MDDDERAETWQALSSEERLLLLAAKTRGGEVWDGGDWAPDCEALVGRGLVGKLEVALTPAGHELAEWAASTGPVSDPSSPS